jgi:hypothetical protein
LAVSEVVPVHAQIEFADSGYNFDGSPSFKWRRRRWKIAANWPWAEAITQAWQRIRALPDPT